MADTLPTTTTTPTGPTATGGDRGRALARVAFWAAATSSPCWPCSTWSSPTSIRRGG